MNTYGSSPDLCQGFLPGTWAQDCLQPRDSFIHQAGAAGGHDKCGPGTNGCSYHPFVGAPVPQPPPPPISGQAIDDAAFRRAVEAISSEHEGCEAGEYCSAAGELRDLIAEFRP